MISREKLKQAYLDRIPYIQELGLESRLLVPEMLVELWYPKRPKYVVGVTLTTTDYLDQAITELARWMVPRPYTINVSITDEYGQTVFTVVNNKVESFENTRVHGKCTLRWPI